MGETETRKKATMLTQSSNRAIFNRFFDRKSRFRFIAIVQMGGKAGDGLPMGKGSLPAPPVHVVDDGPAMAMGVELLFRHGKAVSGPVQVLHVDQPDPGEVGAEDVYKRQEGAEFRSFCFMG